MESAGRPIEFSGSSLESASLGEVLKSITGNSIANDSSSELVRLLASLIAAELSFFDGDTTVDVTGVLWHELTGESSDVFGGDDEDEKRGRDFGTPGRTSDRG